jgi:signal peptidase I
VVAVVTGQIAGDAAAARRGSWLRGLVGWLVYLAVIAGLVVMAPRIMSELLNSEHPMATVTGDSMWPAIKKGDVVLLQGVSSMDDLAEGDVIAFHHERGLAIHRIVAIDGEMITTRGDANFKNDKAVTIESVIGKVPTVGGRLARLPYLGHLAFLIGPLLGAEDARESAEQATVPPAGR